MAQPVRANEDDVQLSRNIETTAEPPASNTIQGFGFLIGFIEDDVNRLVVSCASDNSVLFTGHSPAELFDLGDLESIFGPDDIDTLMTRLGFLKEERADGITTGRAVFSLSVLTKEGETAQFWCFMHLDGNSPAPGMVVCEFEPPDDASTSTTEHGSHTSDVTTKTSRMARRIGSEGGEFNTMQAIGIMSRIQTSFAAMANLTAVPATIVATVKEVTEFDRVVLYRVDDLLAVTILDSSDRESDRSHRCIHLTRSRRTGDDSHSQPFPSQLRLLYDRTAQPSRLVHKTETSQKPHLVDLDQSYLNTASPTFFEELKAEDKSARSSMAIPINACGKRWGLVVCYAYRPEGTRISIPKRQICEFIGSTSGCAIERLSYASMLAGAELPRTRREPIQLPGESDAASRDLLRLFAADFALTSATGEIGRLGEPSEESYREALAIVRSIQPHKSQSVIVSSDVTAELPDVGIPGVRTISGLLWAPLQMYGGDFVVLFRHKQTSSLASGEGAPSTSSTEPQAVSASVSACEWSDKHVRMATALGSLGRQLPRSPQLKDGVSMALQSALAVAKLEPYVYRAVGSIVESLDNTLGNLGEQHVAYDDVDQAYFSSRALAYLLNDIRS
ncbi:hypothetical protein BDP55DRAFT_631029 [Colletotrichum godetiae]|uniref:Phytochrome chromophore attachment site domain-containing protein n=1 Tax=Colletotrichum godetiae TaxID=1209918 RepID=A0AAJ0AN49_9PEZI|nr:uncharacterized protein BDP55DRAFT_631029 [Colletotrichum godetiae]KAK1676946.1 hypothetical protein BDP55DRAFT_631029 [Colletotrichum godetiae]